MDEPGPAQKKGLTARDPRLVKWTSAVAAVVIAGIFAWGLLVSRPGAQAGAGATLPDFYSLAGQTPPNVTLRDLTNTPVTLSSFHGKRVLLNFWYVACPDCRGEMPTLEQFYQQARGQNIIILGLNILDDPNTASLFLQNLGINYPVVLDQQHRLFDSLHLTSTPSSILIDSQGSIQGSVSGPLSQSQLHSYFSLLH
ncbi:MAG TPA: TlpA disulfide reductase family protein [Ktedonobacterales bacterium]|jgi:peroxiredoxin